MGTRGALTTVAAVAALGASWRGVAGQTELFFMADNYCSVYYNGALLYNDIDYHISDGTIVLQQPPAPNDVVAIKGVDNTYGGAQGTGGLLVRLGTDIVSGADWKVKR